MKRTILMSLIVCIAVPMLTGCQESDSSMVQRARLVGSENLKLKKEIEQKEAQIAQLEKQIEELKAENAKAMEESGNANLKLIQMFADSEKTNEKLMQENKELKEQLQKLKAQ